MEANNCVISWRDRKTNCFILKAGRAGGFDTTPPTFFGKFPMSFVVFFFLHKHNQHNKEENEPMTKSISTFFSSDVPNRSLSFTEPSNRDWQIRTSMFI